MLLTLRSAHNKTSTLFNDSHQLVMLLSVIALSVALFTALLPVASMTITIIVRCSRARIWLRIQQGLHLLCLPHQKLREKLHEKLHSKLS